MIFFALLLSVVVSHTGLFRPYEDSPQSVTYTYYEGYYASYDSNAPNAVWNGDVLYLILKESTYTMTTSTFNEVIGFYHILRIEGESVTSMIIQDLSLGVDYYYTTPILKVDYEGNLWFNYELSTYDLATDTWTMEQIIKKITVDAVAFTMTEACAIDKSVFTGENGLNSFSFVDALIATTDTTNAIVYDVDTWATSDPSVVTRRFYSSAITADCTFVVQDMTDLTTNPGIAGPDTEMFGVISDLTQSLVYYVYTDGTDTRIVDTQATPVDAVLMSGFTPNVDWWAFGYIYDMDVAADVIIVGVNDSSSDTQVLTYIAGAVGGGIKYDAFNSLILSGIYDDGTVDMVYLMFTGDDDNSFGWLEINTADGTVSSSLFANSRYFDYWEIDPSWVYFSGNTNGKMFFYSAFEGIYLASWNQAAIEALPTTQLMFERDFMDDSYYYSESFDIFNLGIIWDWMTYEVADVSVQLKTFGTACNEYSIAGWYEVFVADAIVTWEDFIGGTLDFYNNACIVDVDNFHPDLVVDVFYTAVPAEIVTVTLVQNTTLHITTGDIYGCAATGTLTLDMLNMVSVLQDDPTKLMMMCDGDFTDPWYFTVADIEAGLVTFDSAADSIPGFYLYDGVGVDNTNNYNSIYAYAVGDAPAYDDTLATKEGTEDVIYACPWSAVFPNWATSYGYTFTVTGLPEGLVADELLGITGTPTEGGDFDLTFTSVATACASEDPIPAAKTSTGSFTLSLACDGPCNPDDDDDDEGSATPWIITGVVVVIIVGAGVGFFFYSKKE